jgi:hypothetical protein
MGNHYWILGNSHRAVFFKQKNNFNCYGIVDFTNVGDFSPFSDFARNNFSKFKPLTPYFGGSVYNKKYNYNNCGINNRKKIFDFEQEKYLSRRRQLLQLLPLEPMSTLVINSATLELLIKKRIKRLVVPLLILKVSKTMEPVENKLLKLVCG